MLRGLQVYRCCKPRISVGHNTLKVFENVKLQATGMTEWCWPPRLVREIEMSKPKIPICHHEISTSSKVIFEESVSELLTRKRALGDILWRLASITWTQMWYWKAPKGAVFEETYSSAHDLMKYVMLPDCSSKNDLNNFRARKTPLLLLALMKRGSEIVFLITALWWLRNQIFLFFREKPDVFQETTSHFISSLYSSQSWERTNLGNCKEGFLEGGFLEVNLHFCEFLRYVRFSRRLHFEWLFLIIVGNFPVF